jgi:hypothetical protein
VDEWLCQARDKLAAATGEDPSVYELSREEIEELLELARIAAHESGERINAHGRRGGDLAGLVDAAVGSA